MLYHGPEPSSQDEIMSMEVAKNLLAAKGSNPTPLDYAKQQTADFINFNEMNTTVDNLVDSVYLKPFPLNYASKSKSFLPIDRGAISRVNFPSQDNFSGIYPNTFETSFNPVKDPGNDSMVKVTEVDISRFKVFNNFLIHCKWVAKVDTRKAIDLYADFYPNETTHWEEYSMGVAFREATNAAYAFGAAAFRVYIDPSNKNTQKITFKAKFLNNFHGGIGYSSDDRNFIKYVLTPMKA